MDKLDKMINEALDAEDREVLDRIGWEQSSLDIAGDMFRGKISLLNLPLIFGQIVFFGIGFYAAWQAYNVQEVVDVIRWGLASVVFLLSAVIAKVGLMPSFQANRTLHAIKRLEMQVALLAAKR